MSSAAPDVFQFMVYASDKMDDGAMQRRLAVREQHLENGHKLGERGTLKFGRALLSIESIASPDEKMVGSLMVLQGTLDEVTQIIKSDVYYTNGVWDPERLVILPFSGMPM